MKKHNFSAGPSILPQETLEGAADAVREWKDFGGLSLVEVSHRSPQFVAVMQEAKDLVVELLKIPDSHEVIFCQGGASMQFCMVPYNLMYVNGIAGYVNSGTWSDKAIKEARIFGEVKEVASSKEDGYSYYPNLNSIEVNLDYLHITTNNTISGTQMREDLKYDGILVADMSSDIFSRPVDVSKYGLIYAGAQKNLGPAGVCLVIVRKNLLGKNSRNIPSMLNYASYIEKESMFNTPPVFAIYASLLTLRWLKREGGVEVFAKRNREKAELLYNFLDSCRLFETWVDTASRSYMNVVFKLCDENLASRFQQKLDAYGISGLSGHRSVGGYRASLYNAMPLKSVEYLVEVLRSFEKEVLHG